MKIDFTQIRWKNFLATGNGGVEFQLNKSPITLIVGNNGSGKSTILDAICFALFGKAFRNINKNQLINSINDKDCLVEIEFKIGFDEYLVSRGMKPAIFEISKNGQKIDQASDNRDFQKILEQQILKLNFKTFKQLVILGSASFVPFMKLPAQIRREISEDILDVSIFSVMNELLKTHATATKDALIAIDTDIKIAKGKVDAQQRILNNLVESKNERIKIIEVKIDNLREELSDAEKEVDAYIHQVDDLNSQITHEPQVSKRVEELKNYRVKLKHQKDTANRNLQFFDSNSSCPTCMQDISKTYSKKYIKQTQEEIDGFEKKITKIDNERDDLNKQLDDIQSIQNEVHALNMRISSANNRISLLNKMNKKHLDEIEEIELNVQNIEDEKQKVKDLAVGALAKIERKNELTQQRGLQDVAGILLKDTGIKTAIIKKYLPVMNKLINKYLKAMDFYVSFELDEAFQEKIKSRNRDEFSYESFSEGEKMRIDLSILFTWRQIAKMKNSVNTNLLMLDEIFDGSLDSIGIDYFLSLLEALKENTNLFIITHKGDQLFDKFPNDIVRFEKKNDFSVVVGA